MADYRSAIADIEKANTLEEIVEIVNRYSAISL